MVVIKFGGFAPNDVISGFKFGGMVRYRHMYMHMKKSLADFNLAIERHTVKLPNLIPRQIFWLYGIDFWFFNLTIILD